MKKILTLIKREYKESVYKKSFIIMTILMPLLMVALGVIPSLLIRLESGKSKDLHIIDQSGLVYESLKMSMQDTLESGEMRFRLSLIDVGADSLQAAIDAEKKLISKDEISGLIIVPALVLQNEPVKFMARNVANFNLNSRIRQSVSQIISMYRIKKSGLDPQTVSKLIQPVQLKTIKISKGGKESERGFMEEYFGTFVFVLILYMTLILYGTSIMRSIVQEKSSRIIEVLLSGSNPFQLMAGKIIGQGAVGLTQYLLWAAFGILFVLYGGNVVPISTKYFSFAPHIFIYFILFYVLGYFLFSSLFASIGAITNSDEEAQQLTFPVIMLLIVPLIFLGYLVKNPDSSLSVILSLIPFFSPIVMFARINLSAPPFMEIFGAVAILVVTIIFFIWIVSKIYRVGILMYGKRPNLAEIVRWMKYK